MIRKIGLIIFFLATLDVAGMAQEVHSLDNNTAADSVDPVLCQLDTPSLKDNKIRLQWRFTGSADPTFYIVERSTDERNFQTIGVIRPKDDQDVFEFTDEEPLSVKNYYRVRIDSVNGEPAYSQVVFAEGSGFLCKVYPNPVDRILIVRSEVNGEMQIRDAHNRSRIYQNVTKGLQSVDVSILEKGLYSIIVTDKDTNKTYRERLAKD